MIRDAQAAATEPTRRKLMNEPIKAGDLCRVVDGMRGKDSPNIGLIVRVRQLIYECPKLGRIWRCEAEFAEIHHRGAACTRPPGMADFAQSWLRKLPPDPAPGQAITRSTEVEA
jgi:hypothetical protein